MTSRSRSDPSPSLSNAFGAFELDPGCVHLNHGSYGAVPRDVRAEQDRWRARIERNPTGFLSDEYPGLMRGMAQHVARRLGGAADDWVFCENATAAVSSVLHSLPLEPGDEILTTSHAYGAVLKAMTLVAARRRAALRIADLPPLLDDEKPVLEAIGSALTARTRLVVVDHITSPTATILPVQHICSLARAAGVPVLIDGAHAPGQLALDVPALGADWYTGNAHKWLFAPRGCGVLWTARERQALTRPAVLSHGADQSYTAAFDWIGTRDPSAWLCFEAAALAHDGFGGLELMNRNRELAARSAGRLSEEFGLRVAGTPNTRGAMAALLLDDRQTSMDVAARFRRALFQEYRIVVPVGVFAGKLWLRLSAQIYNTAADYERLVRACHALLPRFVAAQ
jgi:isopenicillin-N epimerase